MKPVVVRNLTIGTGVPKIVVPMMGQDLPALLREAEGIKASPAQMAEWRLDWYGAVCNTAALPAAASTLRAALGDLPILATFRTAQEGGHLSIDQSRYAAVIEALALSGSVDLMDIEAFTGEDFVRREVEFCHSHGVQVLLSYHNFERTPGIADLLNRLALMEAQGADLVKIAVMPQSPADVLTLLDATQEFAPRSACPLVTISMGPLGAVTRLSGQVFGSALTFGCLDAASAPGQMDAEALANALRLLSHGE